MSLKLDEKDVRVVASRRYWARLDYRKVAGYFILLLALSIGLVAWLSRPWDYFALVPMLVAVGWFIWWGMGERKAKADLVREWKENLNDTSS